MPAILPLIFLLLSFQPKPTDALALLIPLGILIDPEGKVAFYESGYGINELRAAIAKLGPEFGSVAKASQANSQNPAKSPD